MNENIVVETSTVVEREKMDNEIEVELKSNLPLYTNASSVVKSSANSLSVHEFIETIHIVYSEIVHREKKPFQASLWECSQNVHMRTHIMASTF